MRSRPPGLVDKIGEDRIFMTLADGGRGLPQQPHRKPR